MAVLQAAADLVQSQHGISAEVIDLRTLLPWDADCVVNSVNKTGRLVVSHEAPLTSGFGAEITATIVNRCFARCDGVTGVYKGIELIGKKLKAGHRSTKRL